MCAVALAAVTACSSGTGNTTGPGGGGGGGGGANTGSLTVTITTPSGVTPAVTVTGPSSYTKKVAATQTLSGLAPGSYVIAAAPGMGADPVVGVPYSATVTGSPATITTGNTGTASVSYAQRASQGMMWVANIGTIVGFSSSQLATSGSPVPAVTLHVNASELAIDASGGMWVTYFESDTLQYYTQAQLLAGGSPTPTVSISPARGTLRQLAGLAFDGKGNLWVGDRLNQVILEFTADQITSSGSPTPKVVLSSAFGGIDEPWQMSFDAKGDLWIANFADSIIAGYSPSQLSTGGAVAPFAGISGSRGTVASFGLAFDSAGDLWVASARDTIVEFTPDQLSSLGSPTPGVIIAGPASQGPSGLAFDASGGLWVSSQFGATLWRYSPQQLTTSGAPVPATTLTNHGGSIGQAVVEVFSPHSNVLPLH